MQNESDERTGAAHDPQAPPIELPPAFADVASYVDFQDLVRDLVAPVDVPRSAKAPLFDTPPPYSHPPLSSHDETESLMRQAADYGEHFIALLKAVSSFMRRYTRFAPLRAENLLLRSRMEFEWTVCADQRRFVAESHDAFMREAASLCEALGAESAVPQSLAKLEAARDQVVRDHQRQAEHLVRTYDTETQLSNSQYSMQQKEYRLAQAVQRIVEVLGQFDFPDTGASEPSIAPSVVDQDNIPHFVQYYFDKAGDVRLARDYIIELELEHREERERRMFQQEDQGIQPSIAEEDFEEAFNKRLAEAEQGLENALQKANTAKQVCIDSDLDPERYRHRLRPDPDAGSDRSISDDEPPEAPGSPIPTVKPTDAHSPSFFILEDMSASRLPHYEQYPPAVLNPTNFIIPDPLSMQDQIAGQHDDFAHAPNRIQTWIADVPSNVGATEQPPVDVPEPEDAPTLDPDVEPSQIDPGRALKGLSEHSFSRTGSLSRSRSNEIHSYPLVLEHHPDGTWRVNKAETQGRREQRRREWRQRNADDEGTKYNSEAKRSLHTPMSSESDAMAMLFEGSYRDAVESIRELAATRGSQT